MEVYLLFQWIGESPVAALLYLALSTAVGLFCMMLAKAGIGELVARLREVNRGNMRSLLLFGRLWIAGVLFLFPGYLTDVLALLVLFAAPKKPPREKMIEARGRVIRED